MNHLIDLIQTVDFAVISWIYQAGGNGENIFISLLDFIAVLFSYLGTLRIGAVVFGIYFWFKKETRPITVVLFAAILLSCSITWIIKEIVDRPRPYIMLGLSAAEMLIHTDPMVSFPSGHTASAFTTAAVVSYYFRKWLIPVLTAACIAGLARIYLLVHYPSDILAGAVIGILSALLVIWIYSYLERHRAREADKFE